MRLPDRLPATLETLAHDLTHVAHETSRHARAWSELVGARTMRPSLGTRPATWVRETPGERKDEEAWRAGTGLDAPLVVQTSAPSDFTAGVMARIAAQQAPRLAAPAPLPVTFGGFASTRVDFAGEPVRVLAGTVCIAAMVALTSSCVLAILAPTQALALLGWMLSAGTIALLVLRGLLGLVTSLLAGSSALIILSALGTLTLVTLLRSARGEGQIVH